MDRKEKLLAFLTKQAKIPYLAEEIAVMLGAADMLPEVQGVLDELVMEGKVIRGKKGRYEAASKKGIFTGVYRHNPRGFGFVSPDDGEDFFVSDNNSGGAFSGDIVQVTEIKSRKHSREGAVLKVLERKNETVIGIYKKGIVNASDPSLDMKVKITEPAQLFENCRVVVKITDFQRLRGYVLINLGNFREAESEVKAIMYQYKIPETFPENVLAAANRTENEIPSEEYEKRTDLRNLKTITIDGADAKDLDDAISLEILDEGYKLYVHIADVAHYVNDGGDIDAEAFKRGTSCYLPGRVLPMLPEKLSNGLCSLNPGTPRLALTTAMVINKSGDVSSYEIMQSVIESDYRMEYGQVTKMLLDGNCDEWSGYEDIKEMLFGMETLMKILRARRFEKGSIDFNIPEPKVIIDENGKAADVVLTENTVSNMIIEEFMLCCNRTLAEHAFWANLPFVYRVHAAPDEEKINSFRNFIRLFDLKIPGKATGRRLMDLLNEINNTPQEKAINTILLRSMAKARYEAENTGHFGIGATYYCHFTSPIRRYPDLFCHRVIKATLDGKDTSHLIKKSEDAAVMSSEREDAADNAEREVVKLKICEYMKKHIGEEFEATISSVTNFGFFAELHNGVEGLVRAEDIKGDYYAFDEKLMCLRGERTKKCFRIGDRVKILVSSVDIAARYIDFFLL